MATGTVPVAGPPLQKTLLYSMPADAMQGFPSFNPLPSVGLVHVLRLG